MHFLGRLVEYTCLNMCRLFIDHSHAFITCCIRQLQVLVFKNVDSMSSWRHEIYDFQTGNFQNLTAKGCAKILFTKYFFCIRYRRTTKVLFVPVTVILCRVSGRAILPEKLRLSEHLLEQNSTSRAHIVAPPQASS